MSLLVQRVFELARTLCGPTIGFRDLRHPGGRLRRTFRRGDSNHIRCRGRGRLDEEDRDVTERVKAPAAMQPPVQIVPPPGNPAVVAAPPPAVFKPATAAGRSRPATGGSSAAGVQRFASGGDEPADTPVGDWQSEGSNGAIRIERCGRALCGYALKSSSSDKGEAVLVNMKPNPARNGPATSTATTAAIPITARWYRRVRTRCGSKPVRSDGFIVPATIGAGSAASRRS